MTAHNWELAENQPTFDRYRDYVCSRCGAGPIRKDIYDGKDSLVSAAKRVGVSSDCNLVIAGKIHDS